MTIARVAGRRRGRGDRCRAAARLATEYVVQARGKPGGPAPALTGPGREAVRRQTTAPIAYRRSRPTDSLPQAAQVNRETGMGVWDVKGDEERDHWSFIPMVSVGPLRFGMSSDEVVAALDLGEPTISGGGLCRGESYATFIDAGVSTYYTDRLLYCIAVDALNGPQVTLDGVALVGRVPSEVEQWAWGQAEGCGRELRYTHAGDPELTDLGLIFRAQRAGDIVLSRPVFLKERAEVTWDYVPSEEWGTF